ncbi:MAG: SMC family ATPase [Gemmatimonadetes bacterium]|nr:SMC family ATPase [Gemmatimonadota bacterium]
MQLHRLRLVNFRQHELTEIAFARGLTGIIGANGAGKTTLLEGIAYALYGVGAARGTRDTLKRRGAPPRSRFEVELEFTLGLHRFRITRGLTAAELHQDGAVIANSTVAVTERVQVLLGMSREEFFNTYFTGQKELAVMAAMGPTERAQFLSRVLGYERLRDAQDRLRERRAALRAELTGIEQGLVDPQALAAEVAAAIAAVATAHAAREQALAAEQAATQRLAAVAPDWTVTETKRQAWQRIDGERRVAEGKVAAGRARFEALDRELVTALRAQSRLAELAPVLAEWQRLTEERTGLEQAALAYTARSRAVAQRDQGRQRLAQIAAQLLQLPTDEAITALAAARAEILNSLEQGDKQLEERRTRWTQDVQEARTKLEGYRDRYRDLKDQRTAVEERGPDGPCPTCGRALGKDFAGLLELLGRQMEEVETDGQYFRKKADQLAEEPAEVKELEEQRTRLESEFRARTEALGQLREGLKQRSALEREETTLTADLARWEAELAGPAAEYDLARHDAVRSRLAELEPLRKEADLLAGSAARAETLVHDAAVAEQQATGAESQLATLDQLLVELAWDPESHAQLAERVRDSEAALQGARVSVARATADLAGAERMRDSGLQRQADRAVKAETAQRLGIEVTMLQELDRAFGDLRTELNLQMRPELSDRSSMLLRDLTAGRYADLELDENYVATIVEDGEAKPVISGGEEDVVNLALRLALSQMIAERAGQPLSLLVLDEVFSSLDEERRASVLDLLRALADRFPQVILITHLEGMRDAFDQVIRMSYDVERRVSTAREEVLEAGDVAA